MHVQLSFQPKNVNEMDVESDLCPAYLLTSMFPGRTAGEVITRHNRLTETGDPKNVAQRKASLENIMYSTVCSGAASTAGAELRQIRVCLHKVLQQNSGFYDRTVKCNDLSGGQTATGGLFCFVSQHIAGSF